MPILAIIVAHLLLLPQARSCSLPGYHLFLCLEPSAQSWAPGFLKISCTVASRIEQSLLTHADSNVINVKVLLAGEGFVLSYCYPTLVHGLLYIVKPYSLLVTEKYPVLQDMGHQIILAGLV